MRYNPTLIDQLGKDAPFSWFLYDRAKQNPRYDFADYQHQAAQVEAQLDALGLALRAGEPVADWLDPDDWGTAFVLAVLGIRQQQPALFDQAMDLLDPDEETHHRELVDACLWDQLDDLTPWLNRLHDHGSPVARQSVVAIAHSLPDTFQDPIVLDYLGYADPLIRCHILQWLGDHQGHAHLATIQGFYADDHPDIAFTAACAGQQLGDTAAIEALKRFALHENPHLIPALTRLFLNTDDPARRQAWLQPVMDSDFPARVPLAAIGVAGLPNAIDKLWEPMADADLCRAAGEAFSLLTGVDLEDEDLEADQPPAPIAADAVEPATGGKDSKDSKDSIEEDASEASVDDDAYHADWEDDLPVPNVAAVQGWWHAHQNQFDPGTLYFAGLPVNADNLRTVVANGNQRQRQLAALHLTLLYDHPSLDAGWPPWLQHQQMAGVISK